MADKGSFFGSFARQAAVAALLTAIKWAILFALPYILAAAALVAAYFQGIPWTYAIAAATLAFAAATTGILRFDEWRYRRTPKDKVAFDNIVLGLDYAHDQQTGANIALKKAQVCVIVRNTATFPIYYVIDEMASSVGARVNPRPEYTNKGGIVAPANTSMYRDDIIDMDNFPLRNPLEATVKVKLRYGHEGRERYVITKHLHIGATLDEQSNTYRVPNWTDVPE